MQKTINLTSSFQKRKSKIPLQIRAVGVNAGLLISRENNLATFPAELKHSPALFSPVASFIMSFLVWGNFLSKNPFLSVSHLTFLGMVSVPVVWHTEF